MTAMPRPTQQRAGTLARRWPVRLILVAIVCALVLPGLVFNAILLFRLATTERTRSVELAEATALRTAESLDREVSNIVAALAALATAPALDSNDLPAFTVQLHAVAQTLRHGIILSTPDGQVIASSQPGPQTPLLGSPETVRKAAASRQPVVSNLFNGQNSHEPTIAIDVPVIRGDEVRSVLALSVRANVFSGLLQTQALPEGWIASLIDGSDHVIARSRNAGTYVGQLATSDFRGIGTADHAAWVGTTLEGTKVLAAMQRQRLTDWRVAVGAPLSLVEAPVRSAFILICLSGALTLALAMFLAWRLAGSVAVPLGRLARAGAAIAQGLPVYGVRSSIKEVDAVSRALVQATHDLRSRADALLAERAQLAAIIETVPVGLAIAEAPDGRIISGNSNLSRILRHPIRYSADKDHYHEWIAHHPDGRRVRPDEFPLYQVFNGAQHAELRCLYQCGDGTQLWVDLIAAPILSPEGQLAGGVVAVLDMDDVVRAREAETRFAESLERVVTERTAALEATNQRLRGEMERRAAAEEQLRQSQKMEAVGQLTGGIAHDFNNLLTVIVGNLDLMRRRVPEGAEGDRPRRLLDNALEGCNRAATLVARLLAFSRRQPLAPQPLDANRLVAGMSGLLHRALGDTVAIKSSFAPALWQTSADPNQLENALLNIAVNARDAILAHNQNGGTLTVTTANVTLGPDQLDPDSTPGDYVRIAIADDGCGMTPDTAARAYEPFFTTKPQGQGTGLGLSQVHGFVKQSGGHVALRSRPGEGTTVTIDLPRLTDPARDDIAIPPVPPAPAAVTMTVLVVEDEPAVRRYSIEALRELGHTVLEAGDAMDGLRLLAAHPEAGLLFTDVILPQMSGPQLAAEVRRRRPDLPVLFTSGYTGESASSEALLDPGSLLLKKPFTLEQLARKLDEAITQANDTL